MKVKDLIKHLKKYNEPDDEIAYQIWTTEDVDTVAEELEVALTDEEKIMVIQNLNNNSDANSGMSWTDLEFEIDRIIERR